MLSGCKMFHNSEGGGKHLMGCHMADFLGSVIGSTVSSVYEKYFEKAYCQHHAPNTVDGVKTRSTKPIPPSQVMSSEIKQASSFQPPIMAQQMTKPKEENITSSTHVYDVISDDCCCYESMSEVDQDSPHFMNIPSISGTTAKTFIWYLSIQTQKSSNTSFFTVRMVRYTCKGYWWKISTDESPSF